MIAHIYEAILYFDGKLGQAADLQNLSTPVRYVLLLFT